MLSVMDSIAHFFLTGIARVLVMPLVAIALLVPACLARYAVWKWMPDCWLRRLLLRQRRYGGRGAKYWEPASQRGKERPVTTRTIL